MKLLKPYTAMILGVVFILSAAAAPERRNCRLWGRQLAAPGQCFDFFYSIGCSHCKNVKGYIDNELISAGVDFHYNEYDVRASNYARRLILGYEHFGWDGERGVPTIFIGDENNMTILVGDNDIIDQLLPHILELQSNPTGCYNFTALEYNQTNEGDDDPVAISTEDSLQWGVLTAAALVDSINPCAIAVLLILLGGLAMSVVPPAENDADHSIEDNVQNEIPDAIRASDIEEDRPNQSEQDKSCDTDDDEDKRLEQENDTKEGSPQLSEEGAEIAAPVADKKKDRPPQEQDTSDSSTGTSDPQPLESTAAQRQREHNPASGNVEERISHSHSRRAFISGMAFILSVFISYYLLGFGLFTAISSTNVSGAILLALGIFVIVLGVWNIKDFLCYDKGYNVEIPRSWRPLLKRILGAVSSPVGAFLAGFIVCLFELPCTGGPYLFILGLLGDQNTRSEAAFLLLYYNFIFVLPLIVINCLVFWGASMLEAVGSWKDKYIRYLHLFAGIVLIGLGALAVADSQKSIF